ncbi:MAG: spore coat polysaccharide biosynthesis protein SpsF [Saprospiraceae bacterium]|jgi:spore coat polysaccharide biosynthesis protein SpsF
MKAGLILARTDSNRLPNKALRNLGGKKLIQWSIDGILLTEDIVPILVTTDRKMDDPLIEIAQENNILFYRGSLENIAERVLGCLDHFEIEYFARINGDCPFMNCALLEEGFASISTSNDYDFVTNLIPRAFPYGMSIEILRSSFFTDHYQHLIPDFQEHITSWFYEHIDQFRVSKMQYPFGNDHDIRVVVDTPEDLNSLNDFIIKNPDLNIPKTPLNILVRQLKHNLKSNT